MSGGFIDPDEARQAATERQRSRVREQIAAEEALRSQIGGPDNNWRFKLSSSDRWARDQALFRALQACPPAESAPFLSAGEAKAAARRFAAERKALRQSVGGMDAIELTKLIDERIEIYCDARSSLGEPGLRLHPRELFRQLKAALLKRLGGRNV